jgi:hypothetical protein
MTKRYSLLLLAMFIMALQLVNGQNWSTIGGSSERNGISVSFGPGAIVSPSLIVNDASPTLWGNAVYTIEDRFATSRVTFTPAYKVTVECRLLENGQIIWFKDSGPDGKLYVVGMTEDAVYVHDYATDSLYAFDPATGTKKWVCPEKCMIFGGAHGILFTCDGDPVVNGPGMYEKSLMRLDRRTGTVKWYNTNFVSVGPAPDFCIYGDRLYKWVGAINLPTRLAAIDLNSGATLFYSDEIGGEALQELPLTAGFDGTIYGQRDGGDLWAITDEGSSFSVKWSYTPENGGMGTFGNIGIGLDGNVYFPDGTVVKHLNQDDGTVMHVSGPLAAANMDGTYITTGYDSTVFISNCGAGDGKYFAFSADLLDKKWEHSVPYNYYCGPQISKNGVMIMIGAGTDIAGYGSGGAIPPCPWFVSDTTIIPQGSSITFTDHSSFNPITWEWSFEGGTPSYSTDPAPGPVQYSTAGVYSVSLTTVNQFGWNSVTRDCYITVDPVSFVSQGDNRKEILIRPNPNDGYFSFSTGERLPRQTRIIITDMHGRLVYESDKQIEGKTIDLRGHISRGLYFIHCVSENTTYSGKLIIR